MSTLLRRIVLLISVSAAMAATLAVPVNAATNEPPINETFASISCTPGKDEAVASLAYKAWGVDYPHGVKLHITEQLSHDGVKYGTAYTTDLYTSSTGSWSVPTIYALAPTNSGTFGVAAHVFQNGLDVGDHSATCSI